MRATANMEHNKAGRPWGNRRAEKLVGGEAAMDEILRGLFNRELDWSYPYLTYQEFLDACGLKEEDLDLA